ncbi:MAG: nucleotidyltransferase domain-containing protein [Spirochaetaceae bacterium]|nr:nucleotidyltransferase domain-containing protein [Spirochaetaceae bacterium]
MIFDPAPYAAGIMRENERELARIRARLETSRAEAQRLSRAIKAADPAVRRVFLFGSAARGDACREGFDLDLAMDGGDVYKALDIVDSSEFEVDVVRLDLVPESLRKSIYATGIELA